MISFMCYFKSTLWNPTQSISGFARDIFKMGSWNHIESTGNIIIKDCIRQMSVPLENSVYFGDGDGINSKPA